jgi:glycerophosphoryl diester phosphodiesterase
MSERAEFRGKFKIRTHYFLALILLLHSIFFLIYWISVGDFRADVDQFIIDAVGWRLPYTLILMILTLLIGGWSFLRFLRFRFALREHEWKPSVINWLFIGVWVVFLFIFYFSFIIILQENPSQRGVLLHLINLTRLVGDPIIFLIMAAWLRRLIIFLRRKMITSGRIWRWTFGIILVLILLVGLWLLPTVFPPNWAYQGSLPAKPAIIAHRGASMLAPENTLGAAELAAEYGAFAFETDLRISLDGTPFLMHDETLERTTNISEVFPNRVNDLASSFTLEELKQLNAGLWFIQKDPYNTIEDGLVSQTQLSINQGQEIPTLSEALDLVEQEDLVFLFDMRYPPKDHPYHDEFFDIVLTLCRESGLNGDIWFLVEPDKINTLIEEAPQMTRVIGVDSTNIPEAKTLVDQQYEIVNVDTGIRMQDISAYRSQRLGVNVYTIDQPWLFSQFWLSGVTSITTNNVHTISELNQPFLNLPYARYILFWGLFGIVVAIWLASAQPAREPEPKKEMETPDLLDFAEEDEQPGEEPAVEDEDERPAKEEPITQESEPEISLEETEVALESDDEDGGFVEEDEVQVVQEPGPEIPQEETKEAQESDEQDSERK